MRQPHRNLFFYYRGAHREGPDREPVYEQQLEDNSTKALVNVLEMADRDRVLRPFLEDLCGIRRSGDLETVEFALQRRTAGISNLRQRVALVIAPLQGLARAKGTQPLTGRPDAWVWNAGAFALLLETKIVGQATRQQVHRHIKGAGGWRRGHVDIVERTWGDVYAFFCKVSRASELDPRTELLVGNFLEYLRMTNLADSPVFEMEDFAYFMTDPEERHPLQRKAVRSKLERLTADLSHHPRIRKVLRSYAGRYTPAEDMVNPGGFPRNAYVFWITLGPREGRKACHLSVRIDRAGVAIDCFAPHKSYTRHMLRRIEADPAGFIGALKAIAKREPFRLRLREAYYKDPESSYKGQHIEGVNDFIEVHPRVLNRNNLEQLVIDPLRQRLRRRDLRVELFLVRTFPLAGVIRNEGLVGQIAAAAAHMQQYLEFALA